MSSLQAKILNLLSGIDDPGIRIEISRTIYYLFQVFQSRPELEDQIKHDLLEICFTVYQYRFPDRTVEELKNMADKCADDILRAFRIESMMRRVVTRTRI